MKKKYLMLSLTVITLAAFTILISSFKNNTEEKPQKIEGTVTDIDGNVYKTIKIGNQIWMAENLKTTKYNDGTPIPNIKDSNSWKSFTSGAQCDYDNNPENAKVYGKLYNWHAVNSGKLCPKGWHVPAEKEWNEVLWGFYNWDIPLGAKLKEVGTAHWNEPNTGATNISGFTALPGGYRESSGKFLYINKIGQFWTTKETSDKSANGFNMQYNGANVWTVTRSKNMAASVRCIKD